MNEKLSFNEVKEKHLPKLLQYVPVVARVHGDSHPEFYDVHKLFDAIYEKIKETESEKIEIDKEFLQLREVTKNYSIPEDVCETYEAVYEMLSELDKAYHG